MHPLALVLAACVVVVYALPVFLAVKEGALVFVFVGVDDLSLVSGFIPRPLPIVDCAILVL
jgi:hypothetical protein